MKGCFTTLLLALIAAVFAAFFGRSCHQPGVEEVLNKRVASVIKESHPGVDVKYDHLTAIVSGAVSETEEEELRSKIKELSQGNGRVMMKVKSGGMPAKQLAPWNFTIDRDRGKVTLAGNVGAELTKTMLASNAIGNLDGIKIDNQLAVIEDTVSVPGLSDAIKAIPSLMEASENGRVEASAGKLIVSGMVGSQKVKDKLLGQFSAGEWSNAEIVDRLEVKPQEVVSVTPPPAKVPEIVETPKLPKRTNPAKFEVVRDGSSVVVKGLVDSKSTRDTIIDSANIPGVQVEDRLKISAKTKAYPLLAAATAVIPQLLSEADNGKVEVGPKRVVISGLVKSEEVRGQVIDNFGGEKWNEVNIVDRLKVMAPPKPTEKVPTQFVLTKRGKRITLTGEVASEATKGKLAELAAEGGARVDNQIGIADNIKEFKLMDRISVGAPALFAETKEGSIAVESEKVVVEGLVQSPEIKQDIMGFFATDQWDGYDVVDNIKIATPRQPTTFSVSKTGDDVSITGQVNNPELKASLGNLGDQIANNQSDNQLEILDFIDKFPPVKPATLGIPALLNETEIGHITVTPEEVTIKGVVKDKATKENIMEHFSADQWPGYAIVDKITVKKVKMVDPNLIWNQVSPKKVVLSGVLPDEESRETILEATTRRMGADAEVVDRMKIGKNVRKQPWIGALPGFVNNSLPKVRKTKIEIGNESSKIVGIVANKEVMSDVSLAFSAINPPGKLDVELKVPKPVAPPKPTRKVIPDVALTGKGGDLTLNGNIPTKSLRDGIVNTVIGADGIKHLEAKGLKIKDNVKDEGYLKPLPDFVGKYIGSKIDKREFWLKNKELTLRGIAPSQKARRAAVAMAKPLKDKGVKIIDLIEVVKAEPLPKPPEPEPKIVEAKPEVVEVKPVDPNEGELYSIFFGTSEFHIRQSQKDTAKRLLNQAKQSKGKIVIDGFADERGTADLNAYLSNARANRIREYLIGNGIDADRIISVTGRGAVAGQGYDRYRRTDIRIMGQ